MFDKNMILYGPPGTGKTYSAPIYAVAICDNKKIEDLSDHDAVMLRYNELLAEGRIAFTTFHQSYGYEEFIEGIKPITDEDSEEDGSLRYRITPGVFKSFCEKASKPVLKKNSDIGLNADPTVWKVSLQGTGDNPTRTECMANNHIRIGYDQYGENITDETEVSEGKKVLTAFISRMRIGDIVLSCYSATEIDAIGVITGEYEWHNEFEHYKRLRTVKWLVKGIREDILNINAGKTMTLASTYALNNITLGDVMALLEKAAPDSTIIEAKRRNHVFIIDEINRGNISKIFGELITLIEDTKREGANEAMTAILPYSREPFSVPDNVYILGTMNTADRSIALMDTALRRRFSFIELMPEDKLLEDVIIEDLNIGEMLKAINERITVLYDREHTIGHAFFMKLKEEPTLENLKTIFVKSIIPLLQEYFYEDWYKIQLVLGDNAKTDENYKFIKDERVSINSIFKGKVDEEIDIEKKYSINSEAFNNIESYKQII